MYAIIFLVVVERIQDKTAIEGKTVRIQGGRLRTRRFSGPKGDEARPLMAVIREAVFSILGARVEGAKVADVCAGTGTFGLEALSRGAVFVVFLEKSKKMADLITKNLESLGLTGFAEVWPMDAQKGIQRLGRLRGVDIVFLDPPFFSEAGPRIMEALLKAPGLWRLLIVRFHKKEDWPKKLVDAFQDQVRLAKDKSYGESRLLFLEQREGSDVCAGHE